MIKVVISGILGKMGNRIGSLAAQDKDFEIVGALEAPGNSSIGSDIGDILAIGRINKKVDSNFDKLASFCDVLIEFTNPIATLEHLRLAIQYKKAMVIGTTGFSEDQRREIEVASKAIPIVFSPNMSIGANLLFKISEEAAANLGNDYEVEIVEAHHNQKKDAPSGTAKKLAEAVARSRKISIDFVKIHSIRAGDIVGDHTVIFAGNGERIELTHRAHSRDTFAKGALQAAKFVIKKKTGLYNMRDVIEHQE